MPSLARPELVALLARTLALGRRRRASGGLLRRLARDLSRLRREGPGPGDAEETLRWARCFGALDPFPRARDVRICPHCADAALGGGRVLVTWSEGAEDRWLFECSRKGCRGKWIVER